MARNKYDIDEELESPFNIRHLKRALVYAGNYKKRIILAIIISIFASVIALFEPIAIKYALDVAIPDKNTRLLVFLAAALLLSIVTSVLLARARTVIMTKVGQGMVYEIRRDLFRHLQELSFDYYDSRPHGKILVRIINYINSVSDLMTNGIINFALEIFNLAFIAVFMFMISWRLALVILGGLPVFALVIMLIKNKQRKCWQAVSNKTSNLNAYLHESIAGVRITQLFTREKTNANIFNKLSGAYRKDWMSAMWFVHVLHPAADNISVAVRACVFGFGLLVFSSAQVSLGTIIAMCSYADRFWQPIMNLSNLMNTLINSVAYLERIFEALDEPVTVRDFPGAADIPEIKGTIEFRNVTFSYEDKEIAPDSINVLEKLSFTVKAGESIALVGPTGAGKTTIVNLISRFYNLSSGEILIDGNDISKATLRSLRSQMGIMLQDSFIFSGTLMFNLKYGNLDAPDEKVYEACKIVGIHDYIMSLKDGYNTEVKERGAGLSGGQKQLLSFARTILANPKILILDEATSSIDAKSERYLQAGINHLLKGRTSFIIAHRLSTIRNCDRIMYVSEKGITESGSHDELIAKKGDYYKLYTSQQNSYTVVV